MKNPKKEFLVNTIEKKMIVGKLIVFTVTYIFYVHHSNISLDNQPSFYDLENSIT
jgi:hypothetical protein